MQVRHTGRCSCEHVLSRRRCVALTVRGSSFLCWHGVCRDSMSTSSCAMQCYVIAAAQAGQHNRYDQGIRPPMLAPELLLRRYRANPAACATCSKRQSYGHALIIDPWGTIIGKLDDPLATGVAVADIDMQQLQDVRLRMPVWEHRTRALQACGM